MAATVFWNPSDAGGTPTFTDGDLTLAGNGVSGFYLCRANTAFGSGKKVYFETLVVSDGHSGDWGIGVGTSGASLTTAGGQSGSAACYPVNGGGFTQINGGSSTTLQSTVKGNTICVAVDFTAALIWWRVNGGNWNNAGTANPATGTGGLSLSGLSGNLYPIFSWTNADGIVTANFGYTPFLFSVPAGFSGLDTLASSTPGTTTNWNPANTTAPSGLAGPEFINGYLTWTVSGSSSGSNAQMLLGTFNGQSTGKYYFELTAEILDTNPFMGYGISVTPVGYSADSAAACANGDTFVNGSAGSTIQTFTTGNTVSCAFDLSAGLIWFRTSGGNWNNSALANPAVGIGGISFTAGMSYVPTCNLGGDGAPNGKWVANFGATSYAFTPPSGFVNWPVAATGSNFFFSA